MNKMRFSLLVAGVASLCNVALAQSVDQGKQFLYYHRYKSASDVFDKVLASNPNNIEAIYWKGQTLLDMKDSVAAQDLYSKALQTNGNAPLLLAGMGGVELRFGKTADAKQRFETAISLSKGKDINVLNAIADNNIDAPAGDAQYAVEKLTQATQVKNFHQAETYVLMGDAYRKLVDGGNAVQSYQKALTIDPKDAEAKYKIGRIYETQNNPEFYLPAFEDAVQMDPNYAPAYYELYYHWFEHGDLDKTTQYLDKYIAASDPSDEIDYDKISLLFVAKKYDDAISQSKAQIAKLGDKANPRYYLLMSYCYDGKGDSASAKDNLASYFSKQKPDLITSNDWLFKGKIESKFPADSAAAIQSYIMAINMDTVPANKLKIINQASADAQNNKNKGLTAFWLGMAYPFIKAPNQTDIYKLGFAYYSAGNYKTADSCFCGLYESKYPNEFFGYYWCMKSKVAEDDSVGSQGLAVDAYIKLAQVCISLDSTAKAAGSPDSVKYKKYIIDSYSQLAGYYNNIKKDRESALLYLHKILEVDPNNADVHKFIDILEKAAQRQKQRAEAGSKPSTSTKK